MHFTCFLFSTKHKILYSNEIIMPHQLNGQYLHKNVHILGNLHHSKIYFLTQGKIVLSDEVTDR